MDSFEKISCGQIWPKMNKLTRVVWPSTTTHGFPRMCTPKKKIQLLWGRFFSLPFGVGWGGVGKRSTIVLFEHHRSVSTPSFFYSTIVLFEHHRSVWISSFCLSTIVLFEHHRSVWVSSFCLSTIVLLEHHRSVLSTIVLLEHHRSVWTRPTKTILQRKS